MRIRFDFNTVTLDAELLDTPSAKAIAAALPLSGSVLTWGEEVYFDIPVSLVDHEQEGRVLRGTIDVVARQADGSILVLAPSAYLETCVRAARAIFAETPVTGRVIYRTA